MNVAAEARFKGSLFPFLLLLSGFAGISYELLYARMLGNIIGDLWVLSAAILLTFLLGIGIGARYAHRFWRYLWLIEAGIGLFAIGFAVGGEAIETWIYSSGTIFGHGLGFTLIQCFLLLAPPALLIGLGLPLFAGYLGQLSSGLAFARAYSWHSLGAALTVLLVEFWLLRQLGLQATVFAIAALNLLVAAMLRLGYGELRRQAPQAGHYIKLPRHQLLALALLSIASAIFQLWLVKIAELILGPFRETFALVLALVLLGLAIGTWLVKQFRIGFSDVVLANLFGLIWLIVSFELLSEGYYASLYPQAVQSGFQLVLLKLGLLAALGGLPAISFGATIPALITDQDNVARESGQLLFISSIANATGFLLMVFVLHEHFSYGSLLVMIAAISALGLITYRRGRAPTIVVAGVAVMALVLGRAQLWDEQFLYLGYDNLHSVAALENAKRDTTDIQPFKGPQDVFALNSTKDGRTYLFINGYRSLNLNRPNEQIVGAMSSIFSPRNDKALVLGVGSGATAGTVGLLFDQVDAVEINAVLLENLESMREYNFDLTHARNVNVIHDDGIRYTKVSDQDYSLIINTVTTPLYFSSSKLYTLDFLQTIKQRLTPDGVYVTWVDPRIGDHGMDITLKTLAQAFEQCALSFVNYGYFLLLCSDQPLAMHQIARVAAEPRLQQYLAKRYRLLSSMLPYSLLNSDALRLLGDADGTINTLDYPVLEFEMARLRQRRFDAFSDKLMASMDIGDVDSILATMEDFNPAMLSVYPDLLIGRNPFSESWNRQLAIHYPDSEQHIDASMLTYLHDLATVADTTLAHYKYALQLRKRELFEAALGEFNRVAELDPEYAQVNFFIGRSLEKLGELDQAITYYEKELELDPQSELALTTAGRAYLKIGRPHKSLPFLNRALQLKESVGTHYLRAMALAQLGEKNKAKEALRKSLELSPGDVRAQKALDSLEGNEVAL